MRPGEGLLSLALNRRLWAAHGQRRKMREATVWWMVSERVWWRHGRRVWEGRVRVRMSEGARWHGRKQPVGRWRRRMDDGRVWDKFASSRWQTPKWWELGSTSRRKHVGARWRRSFHQVGVALVSSIVSLLLSWGLLARKRPGAESVVADGINRLSVKDSMLQFEGPERLESAVLALLPPLSLMR